MTPNVAVVAFAATVTDTGAVKAGDPLFANVTTAPPAGAAWDRVTVHVALPFEDRLAAVQESALIVTSACNVTVAVVVVPFNVAVRVAVRVADTVPVEMLNVAVVAFAATVADAGTVSAGEALFVKVTTAPPVGAACASVTVHSALPFEDRAAAVQDIPLTVGDD